MIKKPISIVEAFRNCGLTQVKIASLMGVSDPMVNYWANDKRTVTPVRRKALAKILRVALARIVW